MIPKEQYSAVLDRLAIPTLDLVIFNADKSKVLLGLRNNKPAKNEWYTPGGRILKNEKFSETIDRILNTELGLSDMNLSFHQGGFIEEIFDDSPFDNISEHCINVFFAAVSQEEFIAKGDKQHKSFEWSSLEELLKQNHHYLSDKITQSLQIF